MIAFLVGAGVGFGLVGAARALMPRPPDYRLLHERLYAPPGSEGSRVGFGERVGRAIVRTPVGEWLIAGRLDDLRILERSPARAAARIAATTAAAAATPMIAAGLLALAGARPSALTTIAAAVVVGAVGLAAAVRNLAVGAENRRRSHRQALAAYLELVRVMIAAGTGPEQALPDAAAAGRGPAFDAISTALAGAVVRGETPAEALTRAGGRLAFAPLEELGGKLAAAERGTGLRATIAAMAAALRHTVLTDIESAAQAANVRMTLPLILLAGGVVVWLAYPAIATLLSNL